VSFHEGEQDARPLAGSTPALRDPLEHVGLDGLLPSERLRKRACDVARRHDGRPDPDVDDAAVPSWLGHDPWQLEAHVGQQEVDGPVGFAPGLPADAASLDCQVEERPSADADRTFRRAVDTDLTGVAGKDCASNHQAVRVVNKGRELKDGLRLVRRLSLLLQVSPDQIPMQTKGRRAIASPTCCFSLVAGAGFEPTTFGL
jgi:hypothetical protein